jgi:hypothetical protein
MGLSVNIGGAWKSTVNNVYVNVGGTWKQAQNVYANIGGTWKLVWTASDRWATKANMPTARGGLGAAVASNGKVYVVGGFDGTNLLTTNEEYTP